MTRWSASVRKLQRALMTMELDGAGEGSGKACWVLMRGARADMFGCASHRENFPVASKTSVLAAEKTGQVLVRTRPHPGPREPQRFQSLTLPMSGALNLRHGVEVMARMKGAELITEYLIANNIPY